MGKIISYDEENDILFIHKGFSKDEKFKSNIEIGDLVLDVSTKQRIKGVEIINASEFFKLFGVKKKIFSSLEDAKFDAKLGNNNIILNFAFLSKKEKEIPAKVAVPLKIPKIR